MPFYADTLRQHLDYTAWASKRLLDAAAELTEDEQKRDFQTSDKCVLDTLAHTFAADRIWLERIQGNVRSTFISAQDRHLPTLSTAWPEVQEKWKQWAAPLTDRDFLDNVAYRDLKGNPYETPLWQIVLHVVNHGTHHRGQVSGFIRALGYQPPPLDLIAYYRTLG
jgi:uncharacterized damage-inducible protein DinB